MNDVLSALIAECALDADCFIGTGVEHVHAREKLLAVAPHYYMATASSLLRVGDRIWLKDLRERVVQRQVTGHVVLLRTATE